MISDVTGIRKIRMLYLQLLYRCDFTRQHCFHGERLQHADAFTVQQAADLMRLIRDEYGTEAVTLLDGEPFVHRDLPQIVRHAKRLPRPLNDLLRGKVGGAERLICDAHLGVAVLDLLDEVGEGDLSSLDGGSGQEATGPGQ